MKTTVVVVLVVAAIVGILAALVLLASSRASRASREAAYYQPSWSKSTPVEMHPIKVNDKADERPRKAVGYHRPEVVAERTGEIPTIGNKKP